MVANKTSPVAENPHLCPARPRNLRLSYPPKKKVRDKTPHSFHPSLALKHPILSIDHGDARIGLAATDEFAIGAHPVETVDCRKGDPLDRILEVIAERKIQSVILGLPLRMDGSEGRSSKKVRAFGKTLKAKLGPIPLTYVDERFTTVTASDKLREAGKKAKHQKDIIDQAAAVEILKDHLGW